MDKRGYVWYHTVKFRPARPHKMIFRKALILMKLLHWILIALLSAAAAFCRLRLLAFGFDESGMPVPADLNTLALPVLLAAAALALALLARRLPAQRELCAGMDSYFAFSRTTLPMMLVVLGCFTQMASAAASLVFSQRTAVSLVLAAFLAVGAVCLLAALFALRRESAFPGVILLVPVCALVLALIFFYREHAADPVLRHFYVETLALAALTVLLLEFAAFAFRGGAPRLLIPACGMSVILCAAALAALPALPELLFYAGGLLLALGIGAAADFDP